MPGDQNDSANVDNATESNMTEEATNGGNEEEKFLDYESFSKFYQVAFYHDSRPEQIKTKAITKKISLLKEYDRKYQRNSGIIGESSD